jgi:hypothetical protein
MPAKAKTAKRRVKVEGTVKKLKTLTESDQKKVRGGLLPYIEQDNIFKSTSTNIQDGTSNTFKKK